MSNITDYRFAVYERLASQKLNEILSQLNSHNHGSAGGVAIDVDNAIADKSIAGGKLADGAVDTLQLADGAITTIKIADGSVTSDKLSGGGSTTYQTAEGTDDLTNAVTASYTALTDMSITYTSDGTSDVKIFFNAPFRCQMGTGANDKWMLANIQVDGVEVTSGGWYTGSDHSEAMTISNVVTLVYVGTLAVGDRAITVGWKSGGLTMFQDGATAGSRWLIVE